MSFSEQVKEDLMVKCKRYCCLCNKYCGKNIEIHHILQAADGGSNDATNGIPLCFECHAEVNSYNDRHPRGTKYRPGELERRDDWFSVCSSRPEIFLQIRSEKNVGPLQGMIYELRYNYSYLEKADQLESGGSWLTRLGVKLRDRQYERAIEQGSLSSLPDEIVDKINAAYAVCSRVNNLTQMMVSAAAGNPLAEAVNKLLDGIREHREKVNTARTELSEYLNIQSDKEE